MDNKLAIANEALTMGGVASSPDIRAITNDDVLKMGDVPLDLHVAHLLPCTSGPGLCSLVLSDFLSCQQNKLLEFCSKQKKLKFSGLEHDYSIVNITCNSVHLRFCETDGIPHTTAPTPPPLGNVIRTSFFILYTDSAEHQCPWSRFSPSIWCPTRGRLTQSS